MSALYKPHGPEQIERERVERLNRPKTVCDETLTHYPDANLSENFQLKTGVPAKHAASFSVVPIFTVTESKCRLGHKW
jgi:hypothetical protein